MTRIGASSSGTINDIGAPIDIDTSGLATSAKQLPDNHNVNVSDFPTEYPLPAAQVITLTPPPAITGFATSANQLPDNHQVTVSNIASVPLITGFAVESGGNLATIASAVKDEDAAHTTGDKGVFLLAVRNGDNSVLTSNQGDYSPISVDDTGRPQVIVVDGYIKVHGNVSSEDADSGEPVKVGGKYNASPITLTNADRGDLQLNQVGDLKVTLDSESVALTNGTSTGTIDAPSEAVTITLTPNSATVGVYISGSYTGQLEFEVTIDNSTWFAHEVQTNTEAFTNATVGTGDFIAQVAGFLKFRVRASALSLGSATITLIDSLGSHIINLGASDAVIGHVIVNSGDIAVTGSVTADTELPAAVVLSDTLTNPTTPMVGSALLGWNGSNWVRAWEYEPGDTDDNNNSIIMAARLQGWTGSKWARIPANATDGLLVNLGTNNDVTVTGTVTANISGSISNTSFASTIADGADVTLGAKADAKNTATDTTAITIMQVLKEISYMEQNPASRAVTFTGSTDVATQTTLAAINTKLVSGTDIGDVTINNASGGSAVNIQDGGNTITVDGTVAVTNAGITTIAGAVSGTEMQVDVLTMPTVTVNTHAITVASGGIASGALSAGSIAVGAITAGDTSIATTEDTARAGGEHLVKVGLSRLDTPVANANVSGDGDYTNFTADNFGKLWIAGAVPEDTAHVAGEALTVQGSRRIATLASSAGSDADWATVNQTLEGAAWSSLAATATPNGLLVGNFTSGDTYTALTATAQVIKASAGNLYGYYIYNPNTSAAYVMIYNIAQASVTVGTSTALLVFCIPASSAANLMFPVPIPFSNAGWSIAAATTGGGNTAPTTALEAMVFYL